MTLGQSIVSMTVVVLLNDGRLYMDTMMYLLGSGMMNRPYIWYSLLFLTLMVGFGLLLLKAVEKTGNKRWLIIERFSIFAVFACFWFFIVFLYKDADKEPELRSPIKEFVYQDHEYLIWRNFSIVHNPNCRCHKITIIDSLSNHSWDTVIHDNVIYVYDRFQ